jgi:choline dehydrogenase-like flavoprotein
LPTLPMTFVDLRHASPAPSKRYDICVIGAGAAGLYLASKLARHGSNVVIVEAGGMTCAPGTSIGIEPLFSASTYRGAIEGRAFGWGGSTSRWGGVLVPHTHFDYRDDADLETWRHVVQTVQERSSSVFSALALRGEPDFCAFPAVALQSTAELLQNRGVGTVSGEFLPFSRRNLTFLTDAAAAKNLTVYLNAVVSSWTVEQDGASSGAVRTIEARSLNGKRVTISASAYVIAAGAVESARILLEIDRFTHERMFTRTSRIGSFLSDHISFAIADVRPADRRKAATLFGPLFARGRMRSFRFVDISNDRRCPRHFAHFIFDADNAGFRLAKALLASRQSKRLSDVRGTDIVAGARDLLQLAYDRFARDRLHIPKGTPVHLQLDVEQCPSPANRVHLADQPDAYGRPRAIVNWRLNDTDFERMRLLGRQLVQKWPADLPEFPQLVPTEADAAASKSYDAYHPVGTCRMGTTGGSVLNMELLARGARNLYVLSTGALPSAGTANPTFTMLCLGDRLADRLSKLNH